jgi:hypothetical protein
MIGSARARHEIYPDPWVPEPLVSAGGRQCNTAARPPVVGHEKTAWSAQRIMRSVDSDLATAKILRREVNGTPAWF